MSNAITVGDWVRVVRVLDTKDCARDVTKKRAIGSIFHVCDVTASAAHEGHIYILQDSPSYGGYQYRYHRDELQYVSPNTVPSVGSLVRICGSDEVVEVKRIEQRILIVGENGVVGQVREILSAEESEQYKQKIDAEAKQKRALERALLVKKRDEMVASAQKSR